MNIALKMSTLNNPSTCGIAEKNDYHMAWFQPAWEELSEAERFVLRSFYDANVRQADAVHDICAKYQIERSSAYNKKNRALEHLQTLLYGRD